MSRIHGLARTRLTKADEVQLNPYATGIEIEFANECFCGRIFYSEKEFRDHVNNFG